MRTPNLRLSQQIHSFADLPYSRREQQKALWIKQQQQLMNITAFGEKKKSFFFIRRIQKPKVSEHFTQTGTARCFWFSRRSAGPRLPAALETRSYFFSPNPWHPSLRAGATLSHTHTQSAGVPSLCAFPSTRWRRDPWLLRHGGARDGGTDRGLDE